MQRFNVREESMTPNLVPGDEFVTVDTRAATRGNIVALPHPRRADFWLVKRLAAGEGETVLTDKGLYTLRPGEAWVLSDNKAQPGATDSRSFGPVDVATLLPMVTEIDDDVFEQGAQLLAKEDDVFQRIIDAHGLPKFWRRPRGFRTLVLLILEQQVSLESGAAVFQRFEDLVGEVTPQSVVRFEEGQLRDVGVTRQKSGYLIGLAEAIVGGDLDLGALHALPVADASRKLQEIKGIGTWTADAYLLSAECRPDVFPVGDRALQVGTGEVLGMSAAPDAEELEILSHPWRPIRAIAARLIWHAYLTKRGRVEPEH